ncbi:MAG: hypothetical protein CL802_13565 [Citromicrobium sp.]|nr:hypothetical protein [Citromicrobium sp.]|tara:strand:+ start:1115 stop:1339 length:225 start_codon:yes stop_codon:yes gene_type:complete
MNQPARTIRASAPAPDEFECLHALAAMDGLEILLEQQAPEATIAAEPLAALCRCVFDAARDAILWLPQQAANDA